MTSDARFLRLYAETKKNFNKFLVDQLAELVTMSRGNQFQLEIGAKGLIPTQRELIRRINAIVFSDRVEGGK